MSQLIVYFSDISMSIDSSKLINSQICQKKNINFCRDIQHCNYAHLSGYTMANFKELEGVCYKTLEGVQLTCHSYFLVVQIVWSFGNRHVPYLLFWLTRRWILQNFEEAFVCGSQVYSSSCFGRYCTKYEHISHAHEVREMEVLPTVLK